jgi:hypothetical protein
MPLLDKGMCRRLRRFLGKRLKRRTVVRIEFELATPSSKNEAHEYFDPQVDEVLLIDLADAISRHCMEFHDIPGFRLLKYTANGKRIV